MTAMRARAADTLRNGERIAGAGGIVLLLALFLPWYGTKHIVTETGFALPARDVTINAWQSFEAIDVVLAVVALGAIAAAVATVTGRGKGLQPGLLQLALAAGVIAAALIGYRIIVPLTTVEREIGLLCGLLGALAIAVGSSLTLLREQAPLFGETWVTRVRPLQAWLQDGSAPPPAPRVSPKPPQQQR